LNRPLRGGEWIYVNDVCDAAQGPLIRVAGPVRLAPVIAGAGWLGLIISLLSVAFVGIRRGMPHRGLR